MIVRKTTKEEDKRVNELFAIAFELPAESGPACEEDPGVHHWAAYDDHGSMMSTFTISDFDIQFDGHSCKMGGIGGVATLPQYRRRGGIRSCFQQALPDMYREGYDFSYLYPFSTAYYRKFGYECCVQKMQVSVNLGLLRPEPAEGSFILAEQGNTMTDAIRTIDGKWEQKYNMMVLHSENDYQWAQESNPAEKQEFTYVYFNPDQEPLSYCTFKMVMQPDGRNLVCSRFCFLNKEGFSGLMQLFKSLSSDHMFVKFALPLGISMEYLMPEWAMGAAMWSIQNAGMVRVINAENALKMASYHGSGEVTLQLHDAQIAANNDTFHITFADGKAVKVERTAANPDAVLEISTFSALLSGVTDFSSASQWMNGLEIQNQVKGLWQVFHRKPMMIVDYF